MYYFYTQQLHRDDKGGGMMVSVRTQQRQNSLTEDQARQAESLRRYLEYLAGELNTTVESLRENGFDASISISDVGVAPGN